MVHSTRKNKREFLFCFRVQHTWVINPFVGIVLSNNQAKVYPGPTSWKRKTGHNGTNPSVNGFRALSHKKNKDTSGRTWAQSRQHEVSSVNISQAHKSWEQGLNLNRSWHMATLMRTIPRSVLSHIQRICLFPYLKLFWSATTTSFIP